MLISHRHRFIFIHIYKNAGMSVSRALLPFAADAVQGTLRRLKEKRDGSQLPVPTYPPHITAAELADQIGRDRFRSYFSFAIVRNPWAWQASLYTYMLQDAQHPQHDIVKRCASFREYIVWRCREDLHYQKDFVCEPDGTQLVDFIGRFEELEHHFATICARIGIEAELPHLNRSRSTPYQQFYDDDSRDMVAKAFRPDIEMFQYEFE